LLRVTLLGEDLYCGVPGDAESDWIRESYHESGQTHTYLFGRAKRVLSGPRVPLGEFRGRERLRAMGIDPNDLRWDYKLSADSLTRRSLINGHRSAPALWLSVDVWIVERGRVTFWSMSFSSTSAPTRFTGL